MPLPLIPVAIGLGVLALLKKTSSDAGSIAGSADDGGNAGNAPGTFQLDPSRSAAALDAAIDSLDVENNAKYAPGGGVTHCNLFLRDAMARLGLGIPLVSANNQGDWFAGTGEGGGRQNGWWPVSADDAQYWANLGAPTAVTWINPGGSGHVAVVRPGTVNRNGPEVAAAGASLIGTAAKAAGKDHAYNSFGAPCTTPGQQHCRESGDLIYYVHA
jgi:hypothetical protein